ncbi:nitrile hydratase subunit beta [Pantoea sp. Acro-805]|uniref:Nitrile hydratase subunit beta n=1 Tax=Candidatus Pantoea formicae TaxID=2608355 RepID=A0ABX0QPA0_9GAMM|nr:nitrile hydratase subunit beta [Pantoea formicae]
MNTYTPQGYLDLITTPPNYHRPVDVTPEFQPGDSIVTHNLNPLLHTRLPRYARGKKGVIVANYGACVFPDALVAEQQEKPQFVYLVKFSSKELWGESSENFSVHLSIWADYILGKSEGAAHG